MDYLKRALAPINDVAWTAIETDATDALRSNLSARNVIDFDGPHGYDRSAVNIGRLASEPAGKEASSFEGVHFGVRRVQPLIEVRSSFRMPMSEIDDVARGAEDLNTEPVILAARRLAAFEERAVYYGLPSGGIAGLFSADINPPVKLGAHPAAIPESVAQALIKLSAEGVDGPYTLILASELYRTLAGDVSAYPPLSRVEKLLGGPVLHSPVLEGGVVLSKRGGDYRLTVGQDFAIGYQSHDSEAVELFLIETFTFRLLAAEAVVRLVA